MTASARHFRQIVAVEGGAAAAAAADDDDDVLEMQDESNSSEHYHACVGYATWWHRHTCQAARQPTQLEMHVLNIDNVDTAKSAWWLLS